MHVEDFTSAIHPRWQRYLQGKGELALTGHSLRLVNRDTNCDAYTNAQIDDYQGLSRRRFPWRPPLYLGLRARFSHPQAELCGTAGFGFWNDPFMMTGRRLPTLPQAIWFFFSSPPSNMKLDLGVPGHGWKAATLNVRCWPFLLLLPIAPVAVPLMNLRPLYRILWPVGQRAIGVRESILNVEMTEWHTYELEWGIRAARFLVDAAPALVCDSAPQGPLGFVMWLDNQFAIVTPWGHFGHGLLEAPGEQWLEVDNLIIRDEKETT